MSFENIEFWIFFFPFLLLYWIMSPPIRQWLTLGFSYFFYASWDIIFLFPLMISTGVDFWAAKKIEKTENILKRKIYLASSISSNIGLLIFFKYRLISSPDLEGLQTLSYSFFELVMPVGISFYTFQTISYTFDVYRGRIKALNSFLTFALYVSFFPQLVAGPIEKARHLLPQLQRGGDFSSRLFREGLILCLLGLFKKLVPASYLAMQTNFFWLEHNNNILYWFFAGILTAFQIYLDFSAYSDIARGLAALLGIRLMVNFRPFIFSTNPEQFWKSWHISLTSWIREYVIISTRNKSWHSISQKLHILLIFLLVGIWHDYTWNWVFFGFFHGIVFISYRVLRRYLPTDNRFKVIFKSLGLLFMFCVYSVGGFLHSTYYIGEFLLEDIFNLVFELNGVGVNISSFLINSAPIFIPLFIYEYILIRKNDDDWLEKSPKVIQLFFISYMVSAILFFSGPKTMGFIYFDF